MSDAQGKFIWYELLTGDVDAATAFYAEVIGWSIAPSGMPDIDYRIASAPDGVSIGGLMTRPGGMAGVPTWIGYIAVDDVDASATAIGSVGGVIHMPPMTLPGVGRMAMVADPQQIPFYVMRSESDEPSHAFVTADKAVPGHVVWNELSVPDPAAAIAFYGEQFGWRQEGAMPMGDLGDYQFLHAGSDTIGAVMGQMPGGRDGWKYYFLVTDIDAAVDRLRTAGGTLLQGPDPIPGGAFTIVAEDPQGARFGLVGMRVA